MAEIGTVSVRIVPTPGDPSKRVELRVYEPFKDKFAQEHSDIYITYRKEIAQKIEELVPSVTTVIPEQVVDEKGYEVVGYRYHIYFTGYEFPEREVNTVIFYLVRVKVAEDQIKQAESEMELGNQSIDQWNTLLEKVRKPDGA